MQRPVLLLLGYMLAALAQQPDTPTFTTGAQLVIETVAVTGKDGKPVEGLSAKDFTVTEDGVPQSIRFFEYQKLQESSAASSIPEHARIYEKLARTSIAPERPGSTRYRDRRLLALYFDFTAMPSGDQLRALAAARKFIRNQMSIADLVAVMRYSGGAVDVLLDFTDDRNRLLSIIETMIVGEGQGFDESSSDASAADTGAAFGQDDSEFNIFNTDRQLSSLQTAAKMLGQLSEKKVLLYFASGLQLNGLNNQAQLRATINTAIRAGVSFWPVDARGLMAQAPLGDATRGAPGTAGMYTGAAALAATTNFQQSQDSLYTLAADTGGKALLDSNDLAKGIIDAAHSVSSYYILGYYTTNPAQDGRFRRVRISLNTGTTSSKLDYRQGYFAAKLFAKFTAADKERQLEDALMLSDPITELTIAMELDYFQLNRAEYFVPITVRIPGRELALAKRGGAQRTLIDFIGEVKDAAGTTVMNVRDKVNIKLSEATAAELAKLPIEYDAGFTLLPGKYTIKFLARDAETGRIGTYQATFVIPNLNKEDKRIPLSSVILSRQRVPLKEALYNATKEKDKSEVANPLVENGQKLVPSVTRVFRQNQDLLVYLQAYQPAPLEVHPLVAFVTFYKEHQKAFETQPIEVAGAGGGSLRMLPIQFQIPLSALSPGKYDCQVTVLNPNGQKAAFARTPVVLIP